MSATIASNPARHAGPAFEVGQSATADGKVRGSRVEIIQLAFAKALDPASDGQVLRDTLRLAVLWGFADEARR